MIEDRKGKKIWKEDSERLRKKQKGEWVAKTRVSQGQRGGLIAPHLSWGTHSPRWKENKIQRCGSAEGGERETGNEN